MTDVSPGFFDAVRSGDGEAVARALEADPALIRAASPYGLRPLLEALFSDQEEVVALVLERGAPVDLGEAAALGRLDLLEAALGATPHAIDLPGQGGWTPLHLAAYAGQVGTTRRLLEAGAQTAVIAENRERNFPLHAALAGKGDLQVVRLLLEAGARPDARAGMGVTPLHLAASRGSIEAITFLVEAGAHPEAMDDGRTPADLARERGYPEVAVHLSRTLPA
jgi:ankyrin repeat protein